jgi:hypothetical protein
MGLERDALKWAATIFEVWPASGDWPPALIARIQRDYKYRLGANSEPLKSILVICKANACETVVIERDYYDEDYIDEYVNFYCKTFRSHPQRCLRLHFFAAKVARRHLTNLKPYAKHYLGYTVVRPTSAFATGRTVIRPLATPPVETYVLSRAAFRVNLCGNGLEVIGAPFMQQDINVGACAQAALWMMALFMHAAYQTSRFHPAEISRAATRFLPSSGGRDGLHIDQMKEAVRSMGFVPHSLYKLEQNTTPANLREMSKFIYAYVESEIPVLLALMTPSGGHAVAAIGHTYRLSPHSLPSIVAPNQTFAFGGTAIPYRTSSEWVSDFVVNDDAAGPYRSIPNDGNSLATIDSAIAMTPPQVNLTPADAENHARSFLGGVNSFFRASPFSEADVSDLVLRPSLIRSNKFKERLATSSIHEAIRRLYRAAPLPKFLWLVELSTPSMVSHPDPQRRQAVGELLIDATANPFDVGVAVVGFHLYGRVFVLFGRTPITMTIPDDRPYIHAVRTHDSVP